jgi:exopolysaccharide biosynthesis predicted pyruvyltransferase EpsI
VSDLIRFDEAMLRRRVPDGPILLHGGGNFGDVWPWFQQFREDVVRRFPDRTIVQLPQSVQFSSADAAARANEVLGGHPDFTLLVRDRRSEERAAAMLPDVRTVFSPDSALGWTPRPGRTAASTRMLVLARGDREASSGLRERIAPVLGRDDVVMDWGFHGLAQARWLAVRVPGRVSKLAPRLRTNALVDRAVVYGYRANARQNVDSAVRSFARSRLVVTDRLHAHVLAGLLGIRHLVLDNNYGKISAIHRDYTRLFESGTFVSDPCAIAALAREELAALESESGSAR